MGEKLKTRKVGSLYTFLTGTREDVQIQHREISGLSEMDEEFAAKKIIFNAFRTELSRLPWLTEVSFEVCFGSGLDEWVLRCKGREITSENWEKLNGKKDIPKKSFKKYRFHRSDIFPNGTEIKIKI
jgi:hypothetical protein